MKFKNKENTIQWLENFEDETEVNTAKRLLSELQIIENNKIETALQKKIIKLIEESDFNYFILLPITPISENLENKYIPRVITDPTQNISPHNSRLEFLSNFNPFKSIPLDEIGSEGSIANLLRDVKLEIKEKTSNIKFLGIDECKNNAPSKEYLFDLEKINKLKEGIHFIFVTDCALSGTETEEYIRTFTEHEPFKKLLEDEEIKADVCIGAASEMAKSKIKDNFSKITINCAYFAKSFNDTTWEESFRIEVENLCKKYSENSSEYLGFDNSKILFMTDRRIPDNVPEILIRSKSSSWKPLFNTRRDVTEVDRVHKFLHILKSDTTSFGSPKIYQKIAKVDNPQIRELLLLLAAANRGTLLESHIPGVDYLSILETKKRIENSLNANYIDNELDITKSGLSVLRSFEKGRLNFRPKPSNRYKEKEFDIYTNFYYPKKLSG